MDWSYFSFIQKDSDSAPCTCRCDYHFRVKQMQDWAYSQPDLRFLPNHPGLHPVTNAPQVPGADAAVGVVGKPASLLTFTGARQVHGLYNWLLDSQGGEACDVPQLLAPEPFLGACLHRTEPQVPASAPTSIPSRSACRMPADTLVHLTETRKRGVIG